MLEITINLNTKYGMDINIVVQLIVINRTWLPVEGNTSRTSWLVLVLGQITKHDVHERRCCMKNS